MNTTSHYKDRRDGLWYKCKVCDEFVFKQTLERHLYICPSCNFYFPVPARKRLLQILSPDAWTDIFPASVPVTALRSLDLTDLVPEAMFSKSSHCLMAAGEGDILGHRAVLAVVHPFACPQRLHFVALLIAIRTAVQKALPLITVYSNDSLPKLRATDRPVQAELSFSEVTYLATEMGKLSEVSLPQITVLTDANVGVLSTKFPLGDIVLAERENGRISEEMGRSQSSGKPTVSRRFPDAVQGDVIIDRYISRSDLTSTLGKMLSFFEKV